MALVEKKLIDLCNVQFKYFAGCSALETLIAKCSRFKIMMMRPGVRNQRVVRVANHRKHVKPMHRFNRFERFKQNEDKIPHWHRCRAALRKCVSRSRVLSLRVWSAKMKPMKPVWNASCRNMCDRICARCAGPNDGHLSVQQSKERKKEEGKKVKGISAAAKPASNAVVFQSDGHFKWFSGSWPT